MYIFTFNEVLAGAYSFLLLSIKSFRFHSSNNYIIHFKRSSVSFHSHLIRILYKYFHIDSICTTLEQLENMEWVWKMFEMKKNAISLHAIFPNCDDKNSFDQYIKKSYNLDLLSSSFYLIVDISRKKISFWRPFFNPPRNSTFIMPKQASKQNSKKPYNKLHIWYTILHAL